MLQTLLLPYRNSTLPGTFLASVITIPSQYNEKEVIEKWISKQRKPTKEQHQYLILRKQSQILLEQIESLLTLLLNQLELFFEIALYSKSPQFFNSFLFYYSYFYNKVLNNHKNKSFILHRFLKRSSSQVSSIKIMISLTPLLPIF